MLWLVAVCTDRAATIAHAVSMASTIATKSPLAVAGKRCSLAFASISCSFTSVSRMTCGRTGIKHVLGTPSHRPKRRASFGLAHCWLCDCGCM
jgi:hypothetical protein